MRRCGLRLKSVAASTIGCSPRESWRRIGSGIGSTGGGALAEQLREQAARLAVARLRRGQLGPPSLTQPCASACVFAERADVDELPSVRREPERPLADQDRAAADRADDCGAGADHASTIGGNPDVRGFYDAVKAAPARAGPDRYPFGVRRKRRWSPVGNSPRTRIWPRPST